MIDTLIGIAFVLGALWTVYIVEQEKRAHRRKCERMDARWRELAEKRKEPKP